MKKNIMEKEPTIDDLKGIRERFAEFVKTVNMDALNEFHPSIAGLIDDLQDSIDDTIPLSDDLEIEEEEENDGDIGAEEEARTALASAGFGTDEDYGGTDERL